ncbi:uncharacterized protein LOC122304878 [Carya illinoinensis]|uniref:uncharacterized protein LOC122304878 n=1 Tax=Carya illinoinensis TaxID=32201 RepID=UPI001C7189D9|nr:uncharacterized protein LOC122304878 [Carya illinoinensis]
MFLMRRLMDSHRGIVAIANVVSLFGVIIFNGTNTYFAIISQKIQYIPQIYFRMSHPLFLRILNEVESYEPYFIQRRDNAGRLDLFSMQKITVTLRMLTYGVIENFIDEYIRIGESTTMESLKTFSKTIVSIFSDEYLRSPNANDIARLLVVGEQRGFPGMLGSIDSVHWK